MTGLHCRPGDARSLAEQICAVIEDRGLGKRLGRNARQAAVERFSPEAHTKALLGVYEELLGKVA